MREKCDYMETHCEFTSLGIWTNAFGQQCKSMKVFYEGHHYYIRKTNGIWNMLIKLD